MNAYADKTQDGKSPSGTDNASRTQPTDEQALSFADNRPEAVAQRKLQAAMTGDAGVQQLKSKADRFAAQQVQLKQDGEDDPSPNRTGMPDQLKAGIESLSGLSMDHVRVHYNSAQPASLKALAYAQGSDIHLGPGQEKHLPHEAWHVVQQAQGRVRATTQLKENVAVNDDEGLEQEADEMGLQALKVAPGKTVQRRKATVTGRSVMQLVKPGGIEHATNSCFVAALINTFTVVKPLRNLLIPTNNVLVGQQLLQLQALLWRAVNSVDRTERVTRSWVQLIMASLTQNGIIANAVDTADFSNVMAGVVAALTPGGGQHGQANNMPVSSGEIAWFPGQALESAVYERVEQMQNHANNFDLVPNAIHVTRGFGNNQLASLTFNLYPADGTVATYRLRSIVERSGKYVGGHFISHVDRGNVGQEWWRSDDLNPGGVSNSDIQNNGMRRQGYAYFYERTNVALAPSVQSPGVIVDLSMPTLEKLYKTNIKTYLQKEISGEKTGTTIDFAKVDIRKYDKDTQQKKDDDPTLTMANVEKKIALFTDCGKKEKAEIDNVNILLTKYSKLPTLDVFETLQLQMSQARARIKELHQQQADLLGQYMDSKNEESKAAFLAGIIPGFKETDGELFRLIAGKVTQDDGQTEKTFKLLRNRYLAYIVQGFGQQTSKDRLTEFGGLLGKRTITLGTVGAEFMAGFQDLPDLDKGYKTDKRNEKEDGELFGEVEGNIPEFIDRRFGKDGTAQVRTPNKEAVETGNLSVLLENRMELFPVFVGKGREHTELFSSPLFTAMHHETGHLINSLKGVSGGRNKYGKDDPLNVLTDEEEVYNISLDRYSDKALSQEMGLPERIAHKAYTGLTVGMDSIAEKDTYALLNTWRRLSKEPEGTDNPLRNHQLEISQLEPGDEGFHKKLQGFVTDMSEAIDVLGEIKEAEIKQRVADFIAWCLDQLEHKVYARLKMLQSKGSIVDPENDEFTAMRADLDLLQVQHRRYIAAIIAGKLQLWVHGTLDERLAANEDWQELLENKKGIRIEEESAEEFKTETYSNIARLLARKNGRKLVHSLLSAGNALEIRTPNPEQLKRVRDQLESTGDYGSPEELEKALYSGFGGQAGPVGSDNLHSVVKGKKGVERNSGARSTMSMRTGLKDSEGVSLDRMGKVIFSPNFIELGHEMIHALQNVRGANVKGVNGKDYEGSAWENMSEHSVIAGTPLMESLLDEQYMTENLLREDHDLGVRHGHSTARALQDAIAVRFFLFARDKRWNTRGGMFTKDKTPKGIERLRDLLVAQPTVNWEAIQKVVHDRVTRFDITKSILSMDATVTAFYQKIDDFCTLREKISGDTAALRNYLTDLERYDPFAVVVKDEK